LAHELNNPSAARDGPQSAPRLSGAIARGGAVFDDWSGGLRSARQAREEIRAALKPAQFKDEFARVEREESIQSWLEQHKVQEAWKLAPLLTEAKLD